MEWARIDCEDLVSVVGIAVGSVKIYSWRGLDRRLVMDDGWECSTELPCKLWSVCHMLIFKHHDLKTPRAILAQCNIHHFIPKDFHDHLATIYSNDAAVSPSAHDACGRLGRGRSSFAQVNYFWTWSVLERVDGIYKISHNRWRKRDTSLFSPSFLL